MQITKVQNIRTILNQADITKQQVIKSYFNERDLIHFVLAKCDKWGFFVYLVSVSLAIWWVSFVDIINALAYINNEQYIFTAYIKLLNAS